LEGAERAGAQKRGGHRSAAARRSEIPQHFEHAIEGIFQTTPDGHYLSANPALARMYGYESRLQS
jgi:PAS domain-containing protein